MTPSSQGHSNGPKLVVLFPNETDGAMVASVCDWDCVSTTKTTQRKRIFVCCGQSKGGKIVNQFAPSSLPLLPKKREASDFVSSVKTSTSPSLSLHAFDGFLPCAIPNWHAMNKVIAAFLTCNASDRMKQTARRLRLQQLNSKWERVRDNQTIFYW